jgi:hypothetical protein
MERLLAQPVLMNGIRVGRVVDVLLVREGGSAVGLEVRCEDGQHRFLPLAVVREDERGIAIDSPFALLDESELDFYRERGLTLRNGQGPAD